MSRDIIKLTTDHIFSNTKRQKYIFESEQKIYFKTGLTNNELYAEIAAYEIGKALNIPVAHTEIAEYEGKLGIASYDIGAYELPLEKECYSIKEFFDLEGFIQMCLFDYLTMNEDRSYRNWGIINNRIAPLFDHNLCFGGEQKIKDVTRFMENISSPFYVDNEYENKHDHILDCIMINFPSKVISFVNSLHSLENFKICKYKQIKMNGQITKLLEKRIQYVKKRVLK